MPRGPADNTFVMTRPKKDDNNLEVHKLEDELKEKRRLRLYSKIFEELILNRSNQLSKSQHQLALSLIVPTLSLVIHHEKAEQGDYYRKVFVEVATENELDAYKKCSDQETALCFVIRSKIEDFSNCDSSEDLSSGLIAFVQEVFMDLPSVFIETLVRELDLKDFSD